MHLMKFKLFFEENQYKSEKVNDFINLLQKEGYEVLFTHSQAKGNKIIINQLTNNRPQDYKDLFKKDFIKQYKPEFKKVSGTSEPAIYLNDGEYRGITIVFKDAKKKIENRSSNANETWFVDQINTLTENGPINLNLQSNNKEILIKNIESAKWYGGEGATAKNANKADIILYQKGGKTYGLSIKHISATFYASLVTDKKAEEIGKKALLVALKKNLVEIKYRSNEGFILTKSIGIHLTDKALLEKWMFGDDLKETGTIISYDYASAEFVHQGDNEYLFKAKMLIDNINDVNETDLGNDYPILFILNHEGKRLGDLKNINVRLGSKKRITKNVVMIEEKDIEKIKNIPSSNEISKYAN